jgi:hypothetical protein
MRSSRHLLVLAALGMALGLAPWLAVPGITAPPRAPAKDYLQAPAGQHWANRVGSGEGPNHRNCSELVNIQCGNVRDWGADYYVYYECRAQVYSQCMHGY